MVKKNHLALIVLVLVLGMVSCGYESDGTIANRNFEAIIGALEKKDTEALKGLLSKQSQLDAVDLDANAQAAVEFFQGNVLEFERRSYPSGKTMHLGEVTERYVQPRYIVTTDVGVYWVFFEVYSVYKEKPDEIGVRYIQITSDEYKQSGEFDLETSPGIHVGP